MHNERKIAEGLYWVGASDRSKKRFENMIPLPTGVSYNNYLITDEKTCLFDSSDKTVFPHFLDSVTHVLEDRPLDYIVVQHVEPDHTQGLLDLIRMYPEVTIIGNEKTFTFLKNFHGGKDLQVNTRVIQEGDTLNLGQVELEFIMAPMVHWPEVFVTYDKTNKRLFSADAFGGFGALAGNFFADEVDYEEQFLNDARRYYLNIVIKHGRSVMSLLKKFEDRPLEMILPLHGLGYRTEDDISMILDKYMAWANYKPEETGIVLAYGSMYGNMEQVMQRLATMLAEEGVRGIRMYDVSETHPSVLLSEMSRFSHFVLGVLNYNTTLYFPVHTLLNELKENGFGRRKYSLLVSKSWGGRAEQVTQDSLMSMPEMTQLGETFQVLSAMREDHEDNLRQLAKTIAADLLAN